MGTGQQDSSPFHLIVIGSGPAGWGAAVAAAGLGARVALIERGTVGGDGFLSCAVAYQWFRAALLKPWPAPNAGPSATPRHTDFARICRESRQAQAQIASRHRPDQLSATQVELIRGEARFVDERTLVVANRSLQISRAVIASGSRNRIPELSGLRAEHYIFPEQIVELDSLPERVGVVGAGSRGVEVAQCFARLGSKVTLYERNPRILAGFPDEVASLLRRQLLSEGVELREDCRDEAVCDANAGVWIAGECATGRYRDAALKIVVTCGRIANTERLDLARAGIECADGIVDVGDRLRTTNRRVFAAGDVCALDRSVHGARAQARLVVANALFFGRERLSNLHVPRCIHTDPGVALLGWSQAESARRSTTSLSLSEVDADLHGEHPDGYVSLACDQAGYVRGGVVVSRFAETLIGELELAVHHRLRLSSLTSTLHPYGSSAEAFRVAADRFRRSLLTPFTAAILKRVAKLKR
ncbi:FAD-dependent oxidoreductase [candidate division KSB1 bacterium]|nr:FAD-dependent oxidoreductase [candidate division KSB1 bacterium]